MNLRYARFCLTVMSPGIGGNDISKAIVPSDDKARAQARTDETMDSIVVDGNLVVLRATRMVGRERVAFVRVTPLSNLRDAEPITEPADPKPTHPKGTTTR